MDDDQNSVNNSINNEHHMVAVPDDHSNEPEFIADNSPIVMYNEDDHSVIMVPDELSNGPRLVANVSQMSGTEHGNNDTQVTIIIHVYLCKFLRL
jgi:hypothetical protein